MNLFWQNGSDFLAMGGYGLYVWGSFGVAAVVMLIEVWALRMRRRALQTGDGAGAGLEGSPHET